MTLVKISLDCILNVHKMIQLIIIKKKMKINKIDHIDTKDLAKSRHRHKYRK